MKSLVENIKISNINWLQFSELLGKTSNVLRNRYIDLEKDKVEEHIIKCIYFTLYFAKENDIDMDLGWQRWNNKVDFKQYY